MTSTTNTAAAAESTEKAVQAFYTEKDAKGTAVSLWVTKKTKEGSPDFDGTIGDKRVAGYIHQGPRAGFISFIDSKAGKDDNGHYIQVGTANVVINAAGIPKLAITLVGQKDHTVWAEVSLKAPQDMLVAAGLDLEAQAKKKAEVAEKKAEKAAKPE